MTYIYHTTLQTADTRRSARAEVADDVVRQLQGLIATAQTGEMVEIPRTGGHQLSGGVDGRCSAFTVWAPGAGRVPVCTIGIAPKSRCSATLWRMLHAHAAPYPPLLTTASTPPMPPWCAARLEPGVLQHPDALGWLGDLERCLAWAWLEM